MTSREFFSSRSPFARGLAPDTQETRSRVPAIPAYTADRKNGLIYYPCVLLTICSVIWLNKACLLLGPVFFLALQGASLVGNPSANRRFFIFLGVWAVCLVFWILENQRPINWIVSLALFASCAFMFDSSFHRHVGKRDVQFLATLLVGLLLLNSVIGVFQYVLYRHDDSFIGLYGRGGLQGHGLAIIYLFAGSYLYFERRLFGDKRSLVLAIVFFASFLLCFYGSGIFHALAAFACVVGLRLGFKNLLFVGPVVALALFLINLISPKSIAYNITVAGLFYDSIVAYVDGVVADDMPRKLRAFINYIDLIRADPEYLWFGLGGGTFNSRASFLLNGDYTNARWLPVSVSPIAQQYVFPLWNSEILARPYSDGSMNQPFSSVLALVSEYGLIGGAAYLFVLGAVLWRWKDILNKDLLVFWGVFLGMLMMFENIIEYPEVLFPVFILLQYSEVRARESPNGDVGEGVTR